MTHVVRNNSDSRKAFREGRHFRVVREELSRTSQVTVIVPAYNEGESLADTILSLKAQTTAPYDIIVVDDCSTDDTDEVALRFGATVIRPPRNTGSKAGAQTFALRMLIRHS